MAGSHLILDRQATEVPYRYCDIIILHAESFIPSDTLSHLLFPNAAICIDRQSLCLLKFVDTITPARVLVDMTQTGSHDIGDQDQQIVFAALLIIVLFIVGSSQIPGNHLQERVYDTTPWEKREMYQRRTSHGS